ncbi:MULTISPECIES: hypothetical protein [unclassified Methanoregula]|uniref:hypothetical protein n=1 Tax=unclassified Methanoregula TaxID=2649730 RepID=UPI0009D144BD|nr:MULTISPECIES: hypothetical protein [unclassified Methanoregula]OPX62271.1 MAG: hypothetical protein A4E33_02340 [Methanoregula sp. PtaB.Bin085]OPY32698.1 MAG: hypothetical protein A4E34_02074 [Methanoregula sp. PtaU1.Bin006]
MRFSHISLVAVVLVVTAVALSGCTGSSPAAPSTGGAQSTAAPASGSSGSQASAPSGADLFGNLNYNWVEYKMSTGSGDQSMTIYYKYNKQTGKCSMRFEGAGASQMPASMQEMDCSGTGSSTASADPNQVKSDAKIDCALLEESVTVPAGTFSATRCTVTTKDGMKSTSWIAKGKFLVKTEVNTDQGAMNMVLNAYG